MRKRVEKLSLIVIAFVMAGMFFSCEKESGINSNAISDDQLIEAIQTSMSKSAVIESDLPVNSQSTIQNDYTESYTNAAFEVADLGYEVQLRKGKGSQVGELHYTYFDVNGRELIPGSNENGKQAKRNGDRKRMGKDCFTFELPVTFTMPDESVITIETEEDWPSIKLWYEEHAEVTDKPSINFPVNVVYSDGTVVTVIDADQLMELHQECIDESQVRCFDFIYPITFVMPDDSEITVSDRGDRDAIKAWYEGNPDVDEKPSLVFPVDVVVSETDTLTLNTQEELLALHDICKKEYMRENGKCFEIVLPVTVILADSSEVVVEETEEWGTLREWHAAHPEIVEKPTLVFPVDIIYEDGTTITVNSHDEMIAYRQECREQQNGQHRGGNGHRGSGHAGNGDGNQGNGGNGRQGGN